MRAFNGTARVLVSPWYRWWDEQRIQLILARRERSAFRGMQELAKEHEQLILFGDAVKAPQPDLLEMLQRELRESYANLMSDRHRVDEVIVPRTVADAMGVEVKEESDA